MAQRKFEPCIVFLRSLLWISRVMALNILQKDLSNVIFSEVFRGNIQGRPATEDHLEKKEPAV
jgi:hypothetical protein